MQGLIDVVGLIS